MKTNLIEKLSTHRQRADVEFKNYRELRTVIREAKEHPVLHCVMDFAEKVLLPSLIKQPGQLQFTTRLKFDFFGVSLSNLRPNFVFYLPEGHCPSGKSADQTI